MSSVLFRCSQAGPVAKRVGLLVVGLLLVLGLAAYDPALQAVSSAKWGTSATRLEDIKSSQSTVLDLHASEVYPGHGTGGSLKLRGLGSRLSRCIGPILHHHNSRKVTSIWAAMGTGLPSFCPGRNLHFLSALTAS